MYICYLCNGMDILNHTCKECENRMKDGGKVVDYYGDYAPYIEQESAQMMDGIPESSTNHQCIHLAFCSICKRSEELIINEKIFD